MTAYTERIRYEVNVSLNGWHLFATDSRIRWYKPFQIADMVLVFKERFPEATVSVMAWAGDGHPTVLDPIIEGALSGDIDKDRLAKTIKRFRDQVNRERTDEGYVGGTSEAEAIQPV